MMYLKDLEKEEQTKPQVSKMLEIIMRVKTNKIDTTKMKRQRK